MKTTTARTHMFPLLQACLLALLIVGGIVPAAVADILDTSYSGDGVANYLINGRPLTTGRAVAVDSSKRIVAVGTEDNGSGDTDLVVVRFNTDGSLDKSYKWGRSFSNSHDRANAVAIDSVNRIVVVGTFDNGDGDTDIEVMRFNSDLKPDTTFGPTHLGELVFSKSGAQVGNAVAIDSNNNIIVVGTAAGNTAWVTRLMASDGSYDPSFNGGQIVTFSGCSGNAVVLQNGNILIAGTKEIPATPTTLAGTSMMVLKLKSDGTPDGGFGVNGEAVIGSNGNHSANAIAVDPVTGKIIVVGAYDWSRDDIVSQRDQKKDVWIQRLNSNGSADTDFFPNGLNSNNQSTGGVTFGDIGNDVANAVAIQQDGMIVVVGTYSNVDGSSATWVMRLKSNGQPSNTFNNGQFDFKYAPTSNPFTGAGVALLNENSINKIAVVGTGYPLANTSSLMTVKLIDDTVRLKVTINGNGDVTTSLPGKLAFDDILNAWTEYYVPNTSNVTLTATPTPGYVFGSWAGDCSSFQGPTCTLSMGANKDVTINFVQPTLNVAIAVPTPGNIYGTGAVNSSPSGIHCLSFSAQGSICSAPFSTAPVTLTATHDWDSSFDFWSGVDAGLCQDQSNPNCSMTFTKVTSDITANFKGNSNIKVVDSQNNFDQVFPSFNKIAPPQGSSAFDVYAVAMTFPEDVAYPNSATVNLNGGYNSNFTPSLNSYTTIHGKFAISNGRMNVKNIKVN